MGIRAAPMTLSDRSVIDGDRYLVKVVILLDFTQKQESLSDGTGWKQPREKGMV